MRSPAASRPAVKRARRTAAVVATALSLAVLAGCGSSDNGGATGSEQAPSATHTMPDGTVMSGSSHEQSSHGQSEDEQSGHEHAGDGSDAEAAATGPSPAARMVCNGQVVDDVTRILALEERDEPLSPSSSWQAPMFTCTFDLPEGPLVLTVHDAEDPATGTAHFEAARAALSDPEEIKGMYGLGLPAYETGEGIVAFIRDGKTLQVDATALPNGIGIDDAMDRGEVAYAVATSVLACWVEHAGHDG